MSLKKYDHHIAGAWAAPAANRYFATVNPSTGEPFAEIAEGSAEDIDRAVAAARDAWRGWSKVEPRDRGRILHRISARILEGLDELARLETLDTGFPLRDSELVGRDVAARHFWKHRQARTSEAASGRWTAPRRCGDSLASRTS